jgi:tRNA pseudouridine13 synthase
VKVKATPADFIVQEQSNLVLSDRQSGYAVFQLSKTSWDTFDLIELLARRLGVAAADISVGGMKDRHGRTEQMISVRGLRGRPQPLRDKNFSLQFAGWSDGPVTARDISGNSFIITLRDLTDDEAARITDNGEHAARDGFANYFDSQRFGSARHGAGFMGKEIFLGRREAALRLYFTPSKHDDQKTRTLKRCVTESWGAWGKCAGMGFGEYGRILAYLAGNHRAYHQALEMIDRRFLVFVLNAYQSFLFNEVLARWLRQAAAEKGFSLRSLRSPFGVYEFYDSLAPGLAAELQGTLIPVPGYDTVVTDRRIRQIVEEVLEAEGIRLSDLRVRQMHRIRVGGVERAAIVIPEGLSISLPEEDDLYPGRKKTTLRFFLSRGSYATLLIKRLMLPSAR